MRPKDEGMDHERVNDKGAEAKDSWRLMDVEFDKWS
jgi:hypothetical protein